MCRGGECKVLRRGRDRFPCGCQTDGCTCTPHAPRFGYLVAESGCSSSSPAQPQHRLHSRAASPAGASPARPWLGSGTLQQCHPPVLLVLHLGSPRPPIPPRAAAGLSCGRRGGSQGCAQPHTLPGAAAAARREPQRGGPPPSPLQKQLKMKHTQLHNSAQIRSQHTRQRRPRPPPPALEMPPDLPSIPTPLTHASPGILPPKKLTGKLGCRKRLDPLPYLPTAEMLLERQQRGEPLLSSRSRSGCLPLRPDRSRIQWPWSRQADSGAGGGGGSDLIVFSKTLTKDTDWEQTKHSGMASARQKQKPWEMPRQAGAQHQTLSLGEGDISGKTGSVLGAAKGPGGC